MMWPAVETFGAEVLVVKPPPAQTEVLTVRDAVTN